MTQDINQLLSGTKPSEEPEVDEEKAAMDRAAIANIMGVTEDTPSTANLDNPVKPIAQDNSGATEVKPAQDPSGRDLEVTWAVRRGGGLTIPLEVPNEGQFTVNFEGGTATLRGRAARAMRKEYERNPYLRQQIAEISASDRAQVEKLNRQMASEQNMAERGLSSANASRNIHPADQRAQDRTAGLAKITNAMSPLGG